ncbi:MAG: bsu patB [Dehalococcoidales bacterium]|nr:bsu patB [Dehalococcoidales bacterium]
MMKYDFERVIDRTNTDSSKWNMVEAIFGSSTVLPLWVADMDFPIARPITEAIRKRTEHELYGYARPGSSLIQAVINRMQQKYGWKVEPEWIVFTPGVVSALNVAIRAFTHPGDEVILHDPVYYPFWSAVTHSGCSVAGSPLPLIDGHYKIDLNDLRKRFDPKEGMMPSPSRTKMMILCSPHNPVGRVWSRDELIGMGRIVIDNDAIMVSDEVHCELLYEGFKHIPFASISAEFAQNSLVCMAASKTFNLAGLAASTIIIPNVKLRNVFNAARAGILPQPNVLALVALEAAYREGDEWLEQLLSYLQENLAFLIDYFEKAIPKITVIRPEGTYLVWLDCRQLGMEPTVMRAFFRDKARVGLDDGYLFGPHGAGFQRINIACPRAILNEALKRIEEAVNHL